MENGLHVLRRRSPAATLPTDSDHDANRPYGTSCGAASRVTQSPGGSRGERGEALIIKIVLGRVRGAEGAE